MAKISITIDDDLLSRVDEFVSNNYTSRSGLISSVLCQYLNNQDLMKAIKNIAFSMQVISEKGEISAEQQKELEDFKLLVNMMYS